MSDFNYESGSKVAQAIDKRIMSIAKELYRNGPGDQTRFGRVVSSKDGLFTITIDNATYTNVPALRNVGNISKGEVVVCLVPNNQFNNLMILGVADGSLSGGGESGVTSVGLENATDGGLTVSGSPITSSGTISVGHTNILSSSQSTQAVYPITIDKNGHISSFGNAVSVGTYTHTQATAQLTWTIEHNLGKRPSVTVVDGSDNVVIGDIKYIDDNKITITFSAESSGKAYLN